MVKIVQLLPELTEGGVERGVVELNRELINHGFDSVVISAGGRLADQITADGGRHIQLDVCSKNPLTAPLRILQLRRLIKDLSPDILHARSRVPAWLAFLANRSLKIPFVTTVHGFNSVNAYSRVMTYGDRVICVSSAIKNYIQEHYQVDEDKIRVIPRGVDLDLFNPENLDTSFIEQFKEEHSLEGRFVVSSIGRITQLKDYETFIRGVVEAKKEIPHICGLIVGGIRKDKNSYYQLLKDLVEELDAENLIKFCGSQKNIAEVYALSDLVAICSKKPESFGRTAAEALAMNVPVVATSHGGVVDVVIEGKTGFLFQPGNDKELANRIVKSYSAKFSEMRSFVIDSFSLDQMLEKNIQLYNSLNKEH